MNLLDPWSAPYHCLLAQLARLGVGLPTLPYPREDDDWDHVSTIEISFRLRQIPRQSFVYPALIIFLNTSLSFRNSTWCLRLRHLSSPNCRDDFVNELKATRGPWFRSRITISSGTALALDPFNRNPFNRRKFIHNHLRRIKACSRAGIVFRHS
jgi:hypothetical protein